MDRSAGYGRRVANAARSGIGDIERVVALNVRAFVSHVLDVDDKVAGNLLLDAKVPVLVVAHVEIGVRRRQIDRRVARAERRAQEEVAKRAGRNHASIVQSRLLQQERRHEQIHAAVRILAFVEDPIAAANNRRFTERPPGEARTAAPTGSCPGE